MMAVVDSGLQISRRAHLTCRNPSATYNMALKNTRGLEPSRAESGSWVLGGRAVLV